MSAYKTTPRAGQPAPVSEYEGRNTTPWFLAILSYVIFAVAVASALAARVDTSSALPASACALADGGSDVELAPAGATGAKDPCPPVRLTAVALRFRRWPA